MKLGRFWGLTAPMMLLAFDDNESVLPLLRKLNTSINKEILQDLRIELNKLLSIRRIASIDSNLHSSVVAEYGSCVSFDHGTMQLGKDLDEALIRAQILNEADVMVAEMIIRGEQKGKYIDFSKFESVKEGVRHVVSKAIETGTFPLARIKPALRKCYQECMATGGVGAISDELLTAFNLRLTAPDRVVVDGETTVFSDTEKLILQYYLDSLPRVQSLLHFLEGGAEAEEKVFDTAFFDVIKRKPISLHYMVLNRFDYIKAKQNRNLFMNVVADVKADVKKYRECLSKYVHKTGSTEVLPIATATDFHDMLTGANTAKVNFFYALQRTGALRVNDLLIDELADVFKLYDVVCGIDAAGLNERFSVSLTAEQWNDLGHKLSRWGVCGLNAYSLELFRESVATISLMKNDKIEKSEDDMNLIDTVLSDIEALLSTLRPIGEVL